MTYPYPAGRPNPTEASPAAQAVNWTVAIILIVAQGLASLAVGLFSLFFMMISDGCHGGENDPFICSEHGESVFFGGLAIEYLLLIAGFITSIVLCALAASQGKAVWWRPFIGIAIGVVGVIVMLIAISISAS